MNDHLSQSIRLPDGRALAYAEYGPTDGSPVFYFHGLAASRLEPAILDGDGLAKAGLRLIAADRPGMGGSDFQPERGFSDWPADVTCLADQLGLEKFGLWGVSGGSGYVLACARFIPERLTAAVIVSGAGAMTSPAAKMSLASLNRIMWGIAGRAPGLLALWLNTMKALQGDPTKAQAQMLRAMPPAERAFFEKPGRLEAFIASGLEAMRSGARGTAWDTHLYSVPWDFRLEEISIPVRLLHGESDQNVPAAVARQVAAALPACQATFYPGETHISTLVNHLDDILAALT